MGGLCEGEWRGRAELDLWKGCGEGGGGVVSCGGGMGEFGLADLILIACSELTA